MVLRFPCPITPKLMAIKVDSHTGEKASVEISLNKHQSDIILNPKVREYCEFVKEFCSNYDKYPAGKKFRSSTSLYRIVHSHYIVDGGKESSTPARIELNEHYIEVSKKGFSKMTIPMRIFVLCHEFSHIFLNKNPRDESEADINGAKLYLNMGFPVIELIYSFTKIFGDTPQTRMRFDNMFKFLYGEEK
jgi:hypothetical protein